MKSRGVSRTTELAKPKLGNGVMYLVLNVMRLSTAILASSILGLALVPVATRLRFAMATEGDLGE